MGVRDSFSKLRERLDPKSKERKHKQEGTGSGAGGEGVDTVESLPQLVPHVVVGGHSGGGTGSNEDPGQVHSTDQLTQPDQPVPMSNEQEVGRGADSGQGKDIDEEDDQSYSRSSTPSTPRGGSSSGA